MKEKLDRRLKRKGKAGKRKGVRERRSMTGENRRERGKEERSQGMGVVIENKGEETELI